ncbi:hypothetical protein SDJN02_27330, partial [Cucurbita argyrosperma subsp. argyrosperma]
MATAISCKLPSLSTPFASSSTLSPTNISRSESSPAESSKRISIWRLHATSEETLASESAALVEKSKEIVSGVSTVTSVLLFVAFIGLSILTIGVIYIAVTDFLQKREKEKFEKEEAANNKKSGKRKKMKAKAGSKGFGQKID